MVTYNLSMKEAGKNITRSRTAWLLNEFKTILDYGVISCLKYIYILHMMKYRITCFIKTVNRSLPWYRFYKLLAHSGDLTDAICYCRL